MANDEFYMDGKLQRQLANIRKRVLQKDEDYFLAVDGEEGGGKSVLTMQLAKFVDPSFCLERVVFTPDAFQKAIMDAKKGQAVVFDEAFRGLSSRNALGEVNKLLVGLMMECRQKNLFVFVVMPSFFLLDKYPALWRCKGLFHVYRRDSKRGFWMFFNKKKKKLLYLKGKSTYSYGFPKTGFRGRFLEQYVIDEEEYREKKKKAFLQTSRSTRAETYLGHRNILLWFLHKEAGYGINELSRRMQELKWTIKPSTLSETIAKQDTKFKSMKVIQ